LANAEGDTKTIEGQKESNTSISFHQVLQQEKMDIAIVIQKYGKESLIHPKRFVQQTIDA
jgi:hypothetical protein